MDLVQLRAFDLLRRQFHRTQALAARLMKWVCPLDAAGGAVSGGSHTGDHRCICQPLRDARHADVPRPASAGAPHRSLWSRWLLALPDLGAPQLLWLLVTGQPSLMQGPGRSSSSSSSGGCSTRRRTTSTRSRCCWRSWQPRSCALCWPWTHPAPMGSVSRRLRRGQRSWRRYNVTVLADLPKDLRHAPVGSFKPQSWCSRGAASSVAAVASLALKPMQATHIFCTYIPSRHRSNPRVCHEISSVTVSFQGV